MQRRVRALSFYALLSGEVNFDLYNQNFCDNYSLIINDDRVIASENDFDKIIPLINTYFPNRVKTSINNLIVGTYPNLVSAVKKYDLKNIRVLNIRDNNNKNIYSIENIDESVPIIYSAPGDKRFDLDFKDLGVIENGINYDRRILDDKSFARGLESIVNQIDTYAKNDLEKVVLFDKMLRENAVYVPGYFSNAYTEDERNNHIGHRPQTVLRDRSAVCDGFSNFAAFVLNKVGIECQVIIGRTSSGGHAWNKVKVNGKWYYCDFTYSLTMDRYNGTRYILVSKPTDTHVLPNGAPLPELYTMSKNKIVEAQKNLENTKILMPTYHKADGSLYHVRRPAVTIEEFEVKFDNEVKRVRRPANIVSSTPKRRRRLAKIIDKKD